jgi:hypothetical protein
VSTGTFTDVSKGRNASIFKDTQSTKTFDVSKYHSSSISRVNESNSVSSTVTDPEERH